MEGPPFDGVAPEERDSFDLTRSKLYYPLDCNQKLPDTPFVFGTLRHYEESVMLFGRRVFAMSGLCLLEGGFSGVLKGSEEEQTVVLFPGAGSWFGMVDTRLAMVENDFDNGTYLRHISWAKAKKKVESKKILKNIDSFFPIPEKQSKRRDA